MAELLQRFSGNPLTTTVGQKIEQATDPSLASENWALNMEICDHINDTDEGPRDAVRAIKKRLQQNAGKNFTAVMFTLTVLESCVKNCGKRFHILVTNKDFVQDLVKLIGPKNDPPPIVQEKVLSLIQSWAQAFRAQPELQGVVQVYNELKSKGIEFPAIESEAMPPIHTPQRTKSVTSQPSEPLVASNASVGSAATLPTSHSKTMPSTRRAIPVPMQLSPEQLGKLKSELDVVQANMKVFNEMLTELTPGSEHNDDWELLSELNTSCQSMQTRIVELIERVANEEVTNELLRVNDELNNLFLRYERHAKKHKPKQQPQQGVQQSAAMATPYPSQPPNEPTLIDFTDDSAVGVTNRLADIQLSGINATTASKPLETTAGDLDFDMFAQSRSVSVTTGTAPKTTANTVLNPTPNPKPVPNDLNSVKPELLKDLPNNEIQVEREQDFDEMERWLKEEPEMASMTGLEFERFLAERASAVERQPQRENVGQQHHKPDDKSLL